MLCRYIIWRSEVIRSDILRSVFIRSDVVRSDVIHSVIKYSVGESSKVPNYRSQKYRSLGGSCWRPWRLILQSWTLIFRAVIWFSAEAHSVAPEALLGPLRTELVLEAHRGTIKLFWRGRSSSLEPWKHSESCLEAYSGTVEANPGTGEALFGTVEAYPGTGEAYSRTVEAYSRTVTVASHNPMAQIAVHDTTGYTVPVLAGIECYRTVSTHREMSGSRIWLQAIIFYWKRKVLHPPSPSLSLSPPPTPSPTLHQQRTSTSCCVGWGGGRDWGGEGWFSNSG